MLKGEKAVASEVGHGVPGGIDTEDPAGLLQRIPHSASLAHGRG